MIVGELAPLLFHFTLELLPVAFYLIPVHFWLLSGLIEFKNPEIGARDADAPGPIP
jgi:hypothetical protein